MPHFEEYIELVHGFCLRVPSVAYDCYQKYEKGNNIFFLSTAMIANCYETAKINISAGSFTPKSGYVTISYIHASSYN